MLPRLHLVEHTHRTRPLQACPPTAVGRHQRSLLPPKSIAAPERPGSTEEKAMPDLSPSREALTASLPVLTPETLPREDGEFEAELEGSIPQWLSGSVIRNGPGGFSGEMQHLFDGYACLIKFTFRDKKVYMNRRFLETEDFKVFKKTGKLDSIQFGTMLPLSKILWKVARQLLQGQRPSFTDNASVNTYALPGGKQLIAMTEAVSGTHRVQVADLDLKEQIRYNDKLSGDLTTAHPVIYPDGIIYNMFSVIGGDRYIATIDPESQTRTLLASVPADTPTTPPWVHDITGTENYIVFIDTPTVHAFSVDTIFQGRSEYGLMKWAPGQQKTKFRFVHRKTGQVKTVPCGFDFMFFHFVNSFESPDGQEVYIDLGVYDDPTPLGHLYLQHLHSGKEYTENQISRITVPLDGREPSMKTLIPKEEYTSMELPRMSPKYKFRDYQFFYGTSFKMPTKFANGISKFDVKNGTSRQWYEPNCIATEPLMLPRPGATEEDDGVVTTMVAGADGKGFLLILDAKSFEEIGRAKLPTGLPYGFHNQHYPA